MCQQKNFFLAKVIAYIIEHQAKMSRARLDLIYTCNYNRKIRISVSIYCYASLSWTSWLTTHIHVPTCQQLCYHRYQTSEYASQIRSEPTRLFAPESRLRVHVPKGFNIANDRGCDNSSGESISDALHGRLDRNVQLWRLDMLSDTTRTAVAKPDTADVSVLDH